METWRGGGIRAFQLFTNPAEIGLIFAESREDSFDLEFDDVMAAGLAAISVATDRFSEDWRGWHCARITAGNRVVNVYLDVDNLLQLGPPKVLPINSGNFDRRARRFLVGVRGRFRSGCALPSEIAGL